LNDRLQLFCAKVRTDPALQEQLCGPDDVDEFIALFVDTAQGYGICLDGGAVRAAMQRRVPGLHGLVNPMAETPLPPKGWLPIDANWENGRLYLDWSCFGAKRLLEPFFQGDVRRCLYKPFNRLIRYSTSIDRLGDWLKLHPGLQPSGFIFHMSRCGSTLVSQMLAAVKRNIVISEASPIDLVVRAAHVRPDLSADQHAMWLRWIIGAFGQPRTETENQFFVKLDCWHTLALPLFRKAFPDVPFIFLYRDPTEVLVSQLRMPGIQMIPGAVDNSLVELPRDGMPPRETYSAQVLARICQPVLEHCSDQIALVNYRALPEALWTIIMPHFGLECSESERADMLKVARWNAKTPNFEFTADSETKQQEASANVKTAANEYLEPIYRRIEALRDQQSLVRLQARTPERCPFSQSTSA
jgi:hypothetical protein